MSSPELSRPRLLSIPILGVRAPGGGVRPPAAAHSGAQSVPEPMAPGRPKWPESAFCLGTATYARGRMFAEGSGRVGGHILLGREISVVIEKNVAA